MAAKPTLRLVPSIGEMLKVPGRRPNKEQRTKEYLTEAEVVRLMKAARKGRWGHRDATLILVMVRHGLRVTEACDLRWDQIDWSRGHLHVRRLGDSRCRPIKCFHGFRDLQWSILPCGAARCVEVERVHDPDLADVLAHPSQKTVGSWV